MNANEQPVFSVTELNRQVRELLEGSIPMLVVEGEISNFVSPGSGHWYFTLKDDSAQVRCALFKNRNRFLGFRPKNGDHVRLRAKVSLFEGRGEFQLIGEYMEEAGAGALQAAFESLKKRLDAEGLFDPAHKRSLPAIPQHIGVITSPTGAAIRDILSVLQRRFPAIPVSVYPALVQGEEAPRQLIQALDLANRDQRCDVLIIGRGGGSLEDLWAFNDEGLARAIHASQIPVLSAVGHEIDFSISDFVADLRAPTPSAAAELLSPNQQELMAQLDQLEANLARQVSRRIQLGQLSLSNLQQRLRHPGQRLREQNQRLDELSLRLQHQMQRQLLTQQQRLEQQCERLKQQSPDQQTSMLQQRLQQLQQRLSLSAKRLLADKRQRWQQQSATLHTVSPLATLDRGFAIITDSNQQVIRDASTQQAGNRIEARLAKGRLHCVIEQVEVAEVTETKTPLKQGELPGL